MAKGQARKAPQQVTGTEAQTHDSPTKRPYLKQSDVPAASLEEALRVPEAIVEHYAGKPTAPLFVAKALNVDPGGSQLRVLTGAAIAFGLIDGGAQASTISVTDLAKNILRPREEGADLSARREAVMRPRVFGEFLRNYNGSPFPRQDIGINVLEEMGVPREKSSEVLDRLMNSARSVGLLEEVKGKTYIVLDRASGKTPEYQSENEHAFERDAIPEDLSNSLQPPADTMSPQTLFPQRTVPPTAVSSLATAIADDERRRKVFITHGKNRDLVAPIRKLLEFGELVPVVSVDKQSVSKPVPEKVLDDMRGCGAAIIHVDADRKITDTDGEVHVLLNPNVLIEVGAAMAFYGRRFILLVRDGVKLPSNLQGLYEVRYAGETLDATATISLLEAIKDIKNYALPSDIAAEG